MAGGPHYVYVNHTTPWQYNQINSNKYQREAEVRDNAEPQYMNNANPLDQAEIRVDEELERQTQPNVGNM